MWQIEASVLTQAGPEAVWGLWADVEGWNSWDEGLERCELSGPFSSGARGFLTPKGGSPLPFTLTEVVPLECFSDHTEMPGAVVEFEHLLEPTPEGTRITHRVTISGPAWERYAEGFGKGLEHELPQTVERLARLAEKTETPAGVGR